MQVDIQTAGDQAASELRSLHASETGVPSEVTSSVGVTLLKILTLIGGFFFAFIAVTTLPADLAFISITLLVVSSSAIIAGSEKIIAVFPRNLWIYRNHYPSPAVHHHFHPVPRAVSSWNPLNFRPARFFQRQVRAQSGLPPEPRNRSPRRPNAPAVGGGGSAAHAAAAAAARGAAALSRPSHAPVGGGHFSSPYGGGTGNVAVGGGHDRSPYAGGTAGNVAVGSRRHDPRSTTPAGNVIPGSRRRDGQNR